MKNKFKMVILISLCLLLYGCRKETVETTDITNKSETLEQMADKEELIDQGTSDIEKETTNKIEESLDTSEAAIDNSNLVQQSETTEKDNEETMGDGKDNKDSSNLTEKDDATLVVSDNKNNETTEDTPKELKLMVMFDDIIYIKSDLDLDVDVKNLEKIGEVESIVDSSLKPSINNQSNGDILGTIIYKGEDETIIIELEGNYTLLKQ